MQCYKNDFTEKRKKNMTFDVICSSKGCIIQKNYLFVVMFLFFQERVAKHKSCIRFLYMLFQRYLFFA